MFKDKKFKRKHYHINMLLKITNNNYTPMR